MNADSLRRKLAESVILFLRVCIPGMAKVSSPEFHYEIEKRLLDLDERGFNVVAPRGHAKSSLVAIAFVLWHIFLQDYYEYFTGRTDKIKWYPKYVVIISKTQSEAIKRLTSIKNVLGNSISRKYSKPFRSLFGNYGDQTATKWREDTIVLKDGTIIEAVGTGQQVRGLMQDNQRPTLVVIDDPEDENNTKTIDSMMNNRRFLLQSVVPGVDPKVGRWIVIGTPMNTQCLVVHLHRALGANSLWFMNDEATNSSFWSKPRDKIALDITEIAEKDLGDGDIDNEFVQKDGVLWPDWMSLGELRKHKKLAYEMGVKGSYAREFECKIVGDEDQIFKPAYFEHIWEGELKRDYLDRPYLRMTNRGGKKLAEPLEIAVSVISAIDPAFSVSQHSDRTAIVNIAVDKDDNIYELEGIYKKLPTSMLIDTIDDNHQKFKPHRGVIETNQAQIFMAEELYKQRGINYHHDKPTTKKTGEGSRIERLESFMSRGKFYHRPGSPLKSELLAYPRGRDDYSDAMEKAVRFRVPPRQKEVCKTEKDAEKLRNKSRQYYDYMVA